MKNRKINDFIKKIKELYNNPRGKAILFLGAYFIFFIILIIGFRTGNNSDNKVSKDDNELYNFSLIENNNYHFKYTDSYDNNLVLYEGDRNKDTFLFNMTYNNLVDNYYVVNNVFMKKDITINNYVMSSNPDNLSVFKDIDIIKKILKTSTYDSKTEFNDNTYSYNYFVSTTTLVKLIDNIDIDLDDMPNSVKFITNKNNEVIKIEYDLTNYGKYKNLVNSSLTSSLEYSNFNKIDSIQDAS